jgi:hypothetical protein
MKRALLMMAAAFAVTLAIVFGIRASADALAVVLGVILGVVASVPTTFLVTYMLTRPRSQQDSISPQMTHQPPVVVINAGDKPNVSSPPALPALAPPNHGRQWTVIGDADTDD